MSTYCIIIQYIKEIQGKYDCRCVRLWALCVSVAVQVPGSFLTTMKQSTLSFKSTKGTAAPKPQPKVVKRSVPLDDSSDEEENVSNRNLGEHLDLQDKKGHYRTLYKQAVAVSGDLGTVVI